MNPSAGIMSLDMTLGTPQGRGVDDFQGTKFNSPNVGPAEDMGSTANIVSSNTTAELGVGNPHSMSATANAGHDFRGGGAQRRRRGPASGMLTLPLQMDLTTGVWAIVVLLIIIALRK